MTEINLKDELWENDLDISDLKWFIYHGHDKITLSAMSQEVYDRLDEWNKPKYCLITDDWIWSGQHSIHGSDWDIDADELIAYVAQVSRIFQDVL